MARLKRAHAKRGLTPRDAYILVTIYFTVGQAVLFGSIFWVPGAEAVAIVAAVAFLVTTVACVSTVWRIREEG